MRLSKTHVSTDPGTVIAIVIAIIILWNFLRLTRLQFILLIALIAFLYFKTRRR